MSSSVKEYTLPVAWDVSSAYFSPDGSIMYVYDADDSEKEKEIRKRYPEVKRLYEEYRVALILAAGEEL